MYLLREISRAHSSGYENSSNYTFKTVEELANYVYNVWYDQFCITYDFPEEWDSDDMGCEFPTKEEFAPDVICKKLVNLNVNQSVELFGGFSQYCYLVPNELIALKTVDP
jgi:hypothetical protein